MNQVFSGAGYLKCVPMSTKAQASEALEELFNNMGIPESMTVDGALEQVSTGNHFMKVARKARMLVRKTKPYSP